MQIFFNIKTLLFFLFFVSGFCGLLYQIVWLRISFISFGVIYPIVSVVISVFMLGLSLGSWAGGKWISYLKKKNKFFSHYFLRIRWNYHWPRSFCCSWSIYYWWKIVTSTGRDKFVPIFVFLCNDLGIIYFPFLFCYGSHLSIYDGICTRIKMEWTY